VRTRWARASEGNPGQRRFTVTVDITCTPAGSPDSPSDSCAAPKALKCWLASMSAVTSWTVKLSPISVAVLVPKVAVTWKVPAASSASGPGWGQSAGESTGMTIIQALSEDGSPVMVPVTTCLKVTLPFACRLTWPDACERLGLELAGELDDGALATGTDDVVELFELHAASPAATVRHIKVPAIACFPFVGMRLTFAWSILLPDQCADQARS